MTKSYSKTRSANRAAKRDADNNSRATKTLAAAYSSIYSAVDDTDYVIDCKGRKVRTTDATADDIFNLLVRNRVIDTEDALEAIGKRTFGNLINNGSLIRDSSFSRFKSNNLYWVTEKAADMYGLPDRITLSTGSTVGYAKGA